MKMGQRLSCSSVTYRFRYAPLSASPARTALPGPILIATIYLLFRGQERAPCGRRLLAPAIHHRIRHRVTDSFVAHRPLELINPVIVPLVELSLHGIGNFCSRDRTPNS